MSNLWFQTEKKGFNQLGDFLWLDVDYRVITCSLLFTESKILKLDDGGFLFGFSLTGGKGISDKVDMKLFPIHCAIWVRPPGTKYEIYSMEDKKKIEIESPPLEQVLHLALGTMDAGVCYSGEISINASPVNEQILQAPDLIKAVSPFKVTVIEGHRPIHDLRLESSKTQGKSSGAGKSYGQSQAQKLLETQSHFLTMTKEFYSVESMTLGDLYVFSISDPEKYEWLAGLFKLIK